MSYDWSLIQHIPNLTEEDITRTLRKVNMKVKTDTILSFIMNGYNQLIHSNVTHAAQ